MATGTGVQEKMMFNNLIESSSHKTELRRRGSYFLFTTAIYVVLFTVAGVLSIYAYDARLEEPPIEIVMVSPLDYQPPAPAPLNKPPASVSQEHSRASTEAVRRDPMASVNVPQVAPHSVSAQPNTNKPVPDGSGGYKVGNEDFDPIGNPGGLGKTNGPGAGVPGGKGALVDLGTPPEPPIKKAVTPRLISKGVITGEATFLPKPAYPPIAKQMRAHGPVSVQVLIDETGKVVSATAVSGNPTLLHAAEKAALQARFKPTRLSDQPVKVSGVITYNFVLQ